MLFYPMPGSCQDPCDSSVYELIDMYDGRRESTYESPDTDPIHCDSDVDPGELKASSLIFILKNPKTVAIDNVCDPVRNTKSGLLFTGYTSIG